MTHVMITGCAGFIGYHLAQSLQDDGHKVSGFDNFNHYYDVSLKMLEQIICVNVVLKYRMLI